MFKDELLRAAKLLLADLAPLALKLATAESCTGGLLAALITEVPGASKHLERGFVTYSNEAKNEMLGVPAELIEEHGAVSEAVARAMAEGAIAHSRADLAVSITGVAGPDGGTSAKPVGLVHFAAARRGRPSIHLEQRFGELGRSEIRLLSVAVALDLVRRMIV